MLSYFSFLSKRLFKNKLNWLLIMLIPLMLLLIMVINVKSSGDSVQNNLNQFGYQRNYKQGYQKLTQYNLKVMRDSKSSDVKDQLNSENQLLAYLNQNDLKYDSIDYPSTSYSLTRKMNDNYMMGFTLLIMIFIIVNLFSASYIDQIDISSLLPGSKLKRDAFNLLFGALVSAAIEIFYNLLSLVLGFFTHGFGNFNYPIQAFVQNFQYGTLISSKLFVEPTIIIQILFLIFMVTFTYLITTLCRNRLAALFINLFLQLGSIILALTFHPVSSIAQYLPFSFFDGSNIVTLITGNGIQNHFLTYHQGMLILSISILIILVVLGIKDMILNQIKK